MTMPNPPLLGQFKEALSSDETASVFIEAFLGLNSDEMQMFLNHLVLKLQFEDLYLVLQKVNHRIRENAVLDSQDHDYSTDLAAVKEEAEESGEDNEEESGEHEHIVIKVDPLCQAYDSDSEDQDVKQVDLSFNEDVHLDYELQDNLSSCISASVQSFRLPCDECSETFCFFNELQEHKNTTHRFYEVEASLEGQYKCRLCPKAFISKTVMESHEKIYHLSKTNNSKVEASLEGQPSCDKCSETFWSLSELEDHNQKEHKLGLITLGKHMARWVDSEESNIDRPYKCSRCPKAFISLTEWESHEKIYHISKINDQEFKCLECSNTFPSPSKLKCHMRKHTDAKPYKCSRCSKAFKSARAKTSHEVYCFQYILPKSNPENADEHSCDECTETFSSWPELEYHRHQVHKVHLKTDEQGEKFKCGECFKYFSCRSKLECHMKKHTEGKPYLYKCNLCPKSFDNVRARRSHEAICQELPENETALSTQHSCDECSEIFWSFPELEYHRHYKHKAHLKALGIPLVKEPNIYYCDLCSMNFRFRPASFEIHMKKHATGEITGEQFKCDVCSKTLSTALKLEIHMKKHATGEEFKCDECSKTLSTALKLEFHMRKHTGITEFKCDECAKTFNIASKLKIHMRKHTGERPYICSLCPKAFISIGEVNQHEKKIHIKDPRFLCEECPHHATSSGNLKIHKRTHTKEKPYQCDECAKMFATNLSLQIHIKIHKGIQPFSCEHCQKKFTENSNLKRHIRIHTGEKPYNCEKCGKAFRQKNHLESHLKTCNQHKE